MCLGSSSAPKPQAVLPEAPSTPDPTGEGGGVSDADKRRRAAASGGSSRSTILTSARGAVNSALTQSKTLLGE